MGYPNPSILAWNQTFDDPGLLGGGSHLAKVSTVLEYINTLDSAQDDELLLMMDAYDIHMQLPKSVMLDRYYETRDAAQKRMEDFAGYDATVGEGIHQIIMFGSGKRCAPNIQHSVACYAIPESPLPEDLYGANTDTVIGRNQWHSTRQRYLNSGYILGPIGPMRRMFAEAWKQIEEYPAEDPLDDGSHYTLNVYHGSDQSIFANMYGRQEWAREKLRLKYAPSGTKAHTGTIYGTFVDDALKPSFTHEEFAPDLSQGNPYEFGIYLDFWSDFGHQTINSEWDAQWITYDGQRTGEEQVTGRMAFDCPTKVPAALPEDILRSSLPVEPRGAPPGEGISPWTTRQLYTHLCLERIPVFRHMNGPKEHREWDWPAIWYQKHARGMLDDLKELLKDVPRKETWENFKRDPALDVAGGIWTSEGTALGWDELCPTEYEQELFRDV